MIDEPVLRRSTWQVYTSQEVHQGTLGTHNPSWCWVAFGPRGTKSGAEHEARDAVSKAQAAAYLLADPRELRDGRG